MAKCHSIFLLLPGLAAIHAIAVSGPPISLNVAKSLLASNNATLKADLPDPRFHVGTSIGPNFVPVNPTLVNILYFMADMAYLDHNESVPAKTWNTPGSPEVTITTVQDIQAKYLLWGVFAGIEFMIKNNRFHEVLLTLKLEMEEVGRIYILLHEPQLSGLFNSSGTTLRHRLRNPWVAYNNTKAEALLTHQDTANKTAQLATDVTVGISGLPGGGPLSRFDVFLVCYAALVHLSLAKPDARMEAFSSKAPLNTVFVYVYPWHPSLKVLRAIQLMAYLPREMLDSPQGFREVTFNLRVHGFVILEGTINKEAVPPTLG